MFIIYLFIKFFDKDKAGPIHEVKWSPNSKEFIVIYGCKVINLIFLRFFYTPTIFNNYFNFINKSDMPFAKATLFNHRADPVHDFGINARNTAMFNPQGRHILYLIFLEGEG